MGSLSSAESDNLVTAIGEINALESAIHPYFIFTRVYFKSFMVDGAPPGSRGNAQPSGYLNEDIFGLPKTLCQTCKMFDK